MAVQGRSETACRNAGPADGDEMRVAEKRTADQIVYDSSAKDIQRSFQQPVE